MFLKARRLDADENDFVIVEELPEEVEADKTKGSQPGSSTGTPSHGMLHALKDVSLGKKRNTAACSDTSTVVCVVVRLSIVHIDAFFCRRRGRVSCGWTSGDDDSDGCGEWKECANAPTTRFSF